jgi:hypothetical protein
MEVYTMSKQKIYSIINVFKRSFGIVLDKKEANELINIFPELITQEELIIESTQKVRFAKSNKKHLTKEDYAVKEVSHSRKVLADVWNLSNPEFSDVYIQPLINELEKSRANIITKPHQVKKRTVLIGEHLFCYTANLRRFLHSMEAYLNKHTDVKAKKVIADKPHPDLSVDSLKRLIRSGDEATLDAIRNAFQTREEIEEMIMKEGGYEGEKLLKGSNKKIKLSSKKEIVQ